MNITEQFSRKDVWNTNFEEKLYIEIQHWGISRGNPKWEAMNNGQGVWCYYITITERIAGTELFEKELWLPDELIKFTESSPERVKHRYFQASFNNVEWHGGVTYYEKFGHSVGHRAVKLGCGFNHLWDMERGYGYTLEEVAIEAMQTAIELKALYKI